MYEVGSCYIFASRRERIQEKGFAESLKNRRKGTRKGRERRMGKGRKREEGAGRGRRKELPGFQRLFLRKNQPLSKPATIQALLMEWISLRWPFQYEFLY